MRKYTIAHSFLMITSALATAPFNVIRRQGGFAIAQTTLTTAQTTAAQSSSVSASPTVASNPVTSSSSSLPPPSSSAPASTPATSASTSAISTPTTPSSTSSPTSVALASSPPSTSSSSIQETISASTSIDAQGSPVTIVITSTPSNTSSPSPSATGAPQDNSSHSSTIVGLSVAGGIAALGIIGFIIWKLTRKRFSDLDDPDEAIKWPELNRDAHTDLGNDDLSPQISNTYSANAPSRNPSMFDQTEHLDPYAVPPLPQFNPNQPYRDDPHASSNSGYYDPYRGPIPQSLHDGSVDGHENIPMSTYPPGSRTRSPGPGMAYDMGGRGSPAPGRASPALGPPYDIGARGSPAPGRTISPGPAAALGLDRRPTYDVQTAYSGPPEMALRNSSPGPNVLG